MSKQSCWLTVVCAAAFLLAACGGGGDSVVSTDPRDLVLSENFYGLTVADIDGDGLKDIVSATTLTEDGQLLDERMTVYRQNAASPDSFLNPVHFSLGDLDAYPLEVYSADIQRDGYADVLITSRRESGLWAMLNDSNQPGQLMLPAHYAGGEVTDSFKGQLGVGDVDGDGLPDVFRVTDDSLYWFPQDGGNPGTFLSAVRIGPATPNVDVGDIDGDGLADAITLSGDGALTDARIVMYLNNTASPGVFMAPVMIDLPFRPGMVGLADFDNNGLMDFAVSGTVPADYIPDGVFMAFRQFAPGQFIATEVLTTDYISILDGFAIGNLNGDEFPDVALLTTPKIVIIDVRSLLQPVITNEFEIPSDQSIRSDGVSRPVIGDLNNDMLADIALLDRGIVISFQNPGEPGTFRAPIRITTPP